MSKGSDTEKDEKIAELEQHVKELEMSNAFFRTAYFSLRFLMKIELSDLYKEKTLARFEEEHLEQLDIIEDADIDETMPSEKYRMPSGLKQSKKKSDVSYA